MMEADAEENGSRNVEMSNATRVGETYESR